MTRHRAFPAADLALFSGEPLQRWRTAGAEAAWLLDRGYPRERVLELCGTRHRLSARQILGLHRCLCTADERDARARKGLPPADVAGRELRIDGFNLLISLEVALAGGVVLRGRDGSVRDLAGLRGGYHLAVETHLAIARVGAALRDLAPAQVTWLLDAPFSNSGRLRASLLAAAAAWPWQTHAEVVADPDRVLVGQRGVVSSDSVVIDRAADWFNLAGWLVDVHLPGVRCVRWQEPTAPPV